MSRLLIILIKFYQYCISPIFGQNCRYYPTCSTYAFKAIEKYGCIKGVFLAAKRLMRCHPFAKSGGFDPVP